MNDYIEMGFIALYTAAVLYTAKRKGAAGRFNTNILCIGTGLGALGMAVEAVTRTSYVEASAMAGFSFIAGLLAYSGPYGDDDVNRSLSIPPRMSQAEFILLRSLLRVKEWDTNAPPLWKSSRHWQHAPSAKDTARAAGEALVARGLVERVVTSPTHSKFLITAAGVEFINGANATRPVVMFKELEMQTTI